MNRLILGVSLLVAAVPTAVSASCPRAWIGMKESRDALPPEPLLVLSLQGTLAETDITTQVVLVSGSTEVPVRVWRSLFGRGARQVVVVPERPLADGAWELRPRPGTLTDAASSQGPVGRFTVDHRASTAPPRFRSTPVNRGFSETQYGCGSDSIVEITGVELEGGDLVEVFVQANGFGLSGVETVSKGRVSLGIFMCGGAFDLPRGETFTVTLRPLGTSGVTSDDWRLVVGSTPAIQIPMRGSASALGLSGILRSLSRQRVGRPVRSGAPAAR